MLEEKFQRQPFLSRKTKYKITKKEQKNKPKRSFSYTRRVPFKRSPFSHNIERVKTYRNKKNELVKNETQ